MSEKRRFEVAISLVVTETRGDKQEDFFETSLRYHDLGYEGVVAVEKVLTDMLVKLTDFGVFQAEAMGLGDQLRALFGERQIP